MANNYIKLSSGLFKIEYAYLDKYPYHADKIFIEHKLNSIKFINEMVDTKDEDYRIIFCKINRKDEKKFLECIDILHNNMLIMGYNYYEVICNKLKIIIDNMSAHQTKDIVLRNYSVMWDELERKLKADIEFYKSDSARLSGVTALDERIIECEAHLNYMYDMKCERNSFIDGIKKEYKKSDIVMSELLRNKYSGILMEYEIRYLLNWSGDYDNIENIKAYYRELRAIKE